MGLHTNKHLQAHTCQCGDEWCRHAAYKLTQTNQQIIITSSDTPDWTLSVKTQANAKSPA